MQEIDLSKAVEIFIALGLDKAPALRKIAVTVCSRYWFEMVRYGEFEENCKEITRLVKRFRLGDYMCAISANYPLRKVKR